MNTALVTNRQLELTARVLVALGGGYAFTWGFVALGIAALTAAGVDFHEAETTLLLVAFFVYLALFLWAFAAHGLAKVSAIVLGGAVSMTVSAWAIQGIVLGTG